MTYRTLYVQVCSKVPEDLQHLPTTPLYLPHHPGHNQQVMSPTAQTTTPQAHSTVHISSPSQPAPSTSQHQPAAAAAAAAATASHAVQATTQADGSCVWKQLSQVAIPSELLSRLEAVRTTVLRQLQDLDHVRAGLTGLADEPNCWEIACRGWEQMHQCSKVS